MKKIQVAQKQAKKSTITTNTLATVRQSTLFFGRISIAVAILNGLLYGGIFALARTNSIPRILNQHLEIPRRLLEVTLLTLIGPSVTAEALVTIPFVLGIAYIALEKTGRYAKEKPRRSMSWDECLQVISRIPELFNSTSWGLASIVVLAMDVISRWEGGAVIGSGFVGLGIGIGHTTVARRVRAAWEPEIPPSARVAMVTQAARERKRRLREILIGLPLRRE